MENKKALRAYSALWLVIAAAYGLWMSVFMSRNQYPYLSVQGYESLPKEEFIAKFDGMLQTPLFPNAASFWAWTAASTVILISVQFSILSSDYRFTSVDTSFRPWLKNFLSSSAHILFVNSPEFTSFTAFVIS